MKQKHGILTVLLLLCTVLAYGQRRASADVEVKTVVGKNVVTTVKSVYCMNNGRLVVSVHKPMEYIMETNANSETKIYLPNKNQVFVENTGFANSGDELLSLFLFGRLGDLGVSLSGYKPISTENLEDGMIKKSYKGSNNDLPAYCEIVFKDYLPIYSATLDADKRLLTKVYYSQYKEVGYMPFPHRTTQISYSSPKDSTVTRTVYSNIVLDGDDPMFDFSVPANAKTIDAKDMMGR